MSDDFDPDAFLAKPAEDFDPDAFLAKQPSMATDAVPAPPPERKIGEPTEKERRLGQLVSFLSGSPLFNTVAKAADSLTGQRSVQSAQRATEQFSPKVAGVPLLPLAGGVVATAPAGAARVGGTLGGLALNTPRASALARIGLQGGIGAAQAADRGENVALGTGVGLAGGVGGEAVGAGLSAAGTAARPALTKFANNQAVKALFGGGSMTNRLKTMGVVNEAGIQNLGADVRSLGVLGRGPIPRNAQGINEGVENVLASSGDEIGRIRDLADALVASGKASPADATEMARAYVQGVRGASRLADHTAVADDVAAQAQKFVNQATPAPGMAPTTEGGTFRALWDQSSRMQKGAFKPSDSIGDALAKRELSQAGVQSARRNLSQQMEGVVGPDEMSSLAEAMKRYSTAARISDTTANSAARSVQNNTFGLGDNALVQTMGLTGPVAAAALPLMSLVRSRGNAAAAMYAPLVGRAAAPTLGLAGGVSRFATPATARAVTLKPEDAEAINAFLDGAP